MQKWVGQSVPRLDAEAKASGKTQYLDDLPFEGLYGAVVRSTIPCGTISHIDFDPEFDWNGITIVDYRDIPGENINRMLKDDQPFLAETRVRFVGEPILLLAHADKAMLKRAKAHITITYEPDTPVLSLDDSLAAERRIFSDDNCFETLRIGKGETGQVFGSENGRIIEGTYETGLQEQLYMEPQAMLARWRGGDIKIVGSMQCPGYIEGALECLTGEKVEVEQAPTGGGFGGKEDYPSLMGAYAWLLCRKAQRDVKLLYGRSEDIAVTTKRHPARMHYRSAVDETGRIAAMEVEFLIDGGAYCTLSPVVLSRGILHCTGFYDIPNVAVTGRAMATNTPPRGAFRGFGAPQALFGIERHMDEIAAALGLPPQELRERNLPTAASTTLTEAPLAEAENLRRLFSETLQRSEYTARREALEAANEHDTVKRGIGMALYMHGGGFTGSGEQMLDSRVRLTLLEEGAVEIRIYNVEMGQGALTVLSQRVADTLRLPLSCVRYATPNTRRNAGSGPTVASRTTMVIGDLLQEAAAALRAKVVARSGINYSNGSGFAEAVKRFSKKDDQRDFEARYNEPPERRWDEEHYKGAAYLNYSLGCCVAEVAVDPIDCRVRVERLSVLSEIGTPVNPKLAESQVEGGVIQALGYALTETLHEHDGAPASPRLSDYMIPIAADIPDIDVAFLETEVTPPKGLGELPMDGPAAAVANAVSHALKYPFNTLPVTAERVMEARYGN
jgi:CO/xanthine dehydrogenase Mo-binding subunit